MTQILTEQSNPHAAERNIRWLGTAAIHASILAVFLLAWIAYHVPEAYYVPAGVFQFGPSLWCRTLHVAMPRSFTADGFANGVQAALCVATILWGIAVAASLRSSRPLSNRYIVYTAAVVLVLAFVFPPAFSGDTAAYVTYGRMQALYGLNPYLTSTDDFAAIGDPFLRAFTLPGHVSAIYWHGSTIYGPIWQYLSALIALLLRHASPWAMMMAFKILAAVSLLGMGLAASAIAEHFMPGTRLASFTAVALNPLFLLEGPGSGHNDFIVVALFLCAYYCLLRGQALRCGLALGIAVGIKLFPIALVPWFVLHLWREHPQRVRAVVSFIVLSIAPALLGYIPFWVGMHTLGALRSRIPEQHSPIPVLLVYVAMTIYVYRARTPQVMMTAWMMVAIALTVWSTHNWYPWYVTWSLAPACTQWGRLHTRIVTAAALVSVILAVRMYATFI